MKVFAGSSNQPLAEKIAAQLGTQLSPREIFIFPDGERRIWIEEPVVDEDCVVVQSTSNPVDEHYMELFFLIDGLNRSGARSVTVVMPYVGYQRQDHVFRSGEAVSVEVVIRMLEALKVDKIIVLDLHSAKTPEEFHVPLGHLSALKLFAEKIREQGWHTEDTILVTPDMGGIRRIKILSEMLGGMPYLCVVKDRDLATGSIESGSFDYSESTPAVSVTKRALIVDDMASSGKTLVKAGELLQKNGAEEIIAFATHPIFSIDAPELLEHSLLKHVIVTDTVLIPQEKTFHKLDVLSVAPMIAAEIKETR